MADGTLSQEEIDALTKGINPEPPASSDNGGTTPPAGATSSSGTLSQAEIDALTKGANPAPSGADNGGTTPPPEATASSGTLSQAEIDALTKGANSEPASSEGTAQATSSAGGSSGGTLSQAEIDALTKGAPAASVDSSAPSPAPAPIPPESKLTDTEKDTLGEIGNISMGSAATTLSMLLGHKISITTPTVSIDTMAGIKANYPMPYLIVGVGYTTGIKGDNVLAIQATDAAIIADLMMGGDGTNVTAELDEMRQSAVSEAMNQMMGAVATSLSQIFNRKIDIAPPVTQLVDMASADHVTDLWTQTEPIVKISFRMEVENLIDSEIMQILPINVAKEMVQSLFDVEQQEAQKKEAPKAAPTPQPQQAAAPTPPPTPTAPPVSTPQPSYVPPPSSSTARIPAGQNVQPAQFMPLTTEPLPVSDANIGLILDVPLDISVELGHTKKKIKDILEFSTGSVIELDRLAGEPVDILVNGKLLAKGEVVVIDENFGVRITDIVSPAERARSLQ